MNNEQFRKHAHRMVDWMADYLDSVEDRPVKPNISPRSIYNQIENHPPKYGEDMNDIFNDFENKILPGMTHWQHPNFHAYFPSNNSYPSILAEMLINTMSAQCMLWETSPAATELEEQVMEWLQGMLGLPQNWVGCIQDTASTATLSAILSAREKATNFQVNQKGFVSQTKMRVYCSSQTHSSIDKAVKIAGIGQSNLVKISTDNNLALQPIALQKAITDDLANGYQPICVVASLGTTGTTAIDPLLSISEVCKKHHIWLHIDAAYAGTALVLEEYRWMIEGIETADSFVFNPHKWMFTNFDCTAYFVKNKEALLKTFEITPEYLKTKKDNNVNNYRNWGIPLGRRFRALKLWFVIRSYGVEGIKHRISEHIKMTHELAKKIEQHNDFEQLAPQNFNMICFRYHPAHTDDTKALNKLNRQLLDKLNGTGKVYMTHTIINEKYCIRMVIGQTHVRQRHVDKAWDIIQQIANKLRIKN